MPLPCACVIPKSHTNLFQMDDDLIFYILKNKIMDSHTKDRRSIIMKWLTSSFICTVNWIIFDLESLLQ